MHLLTLPTVTSNPVDRQRVGQPFFYGFFPILVDRQRIFGYVQPSVNHDGQPGNSLIISLLSMLVDRVDRFKYTNSRLIKKGDTGGYTGEYKKKSVKRSTRSTNRAGAPCRLFFHITNLSKIENRNLITPMTGLISWAKAEE